MNVNDLTDGDLKHIAAIAGEEAGSLSKTTQYGVGMLVAAYVQHEGDMDAARAAVASNAGEISTNAEFQEGVETGARIAPAVRSRFLSERGHLDT